MTALADLRNLCKFDVLAAKGGDLTPLFRDERASHSVSQDSQCVRKSGKLLALFELARGTPDCCTLALHFAVSAEWGQ